MSKSIKVIYCRKAISLDEVKAHVAIHADEAEKTLITETRQLNTTEYDAFIDNLMASREWLAGKGGLKNGSYQAIEVTAPNRTTLYVNPEGYDYARYVGLCV